MRLYFDSSALTKRYVLEKGSELIDRLFFEADSIVVSAICLPEIISALARVRRERILTISQYNQCKRAAIEDTSRFEVCQMTSAVLRTSIHILERVELRAMDALHIASALQAKSAQFVSGDIRQIAAAKKFGLKVHPV